MNFLFFCIIDRNGCVKKEARIKGIVIKNPYVRSNKAPCNKLFLSAAINKTVAKAGPTQGVQPNPNANPIKKLPINFVGEIFDSTLNSL